MRCWTLLPVVLVACASNPAPNTGVARPTPTAEVRVLVVGGTAETMTARVASAFMDHALPVSSTTGGVVEAKLGTQSSLVGQYDIVARALIVQSDSGIVVRFYGEETSKAMGVTGSARVGQFSSGRAKKTWESLLAVAEVIQPDASRRTVVGGGRPSGLP